MAVIYKTHYAYLEANFRVMMEALKKDIPELQWVAGEDNIIADGDKCYQYIGDMELRSKVDLHPFQIAFVYLLSYYYPFSQELRQTATGWVDVSYWITNNVERFRPYLKPAIRTIDEYFNK